MRDIILVPAVLIAALIGFRRPAFGMMTFAFLGFFNPHTFTWGFGRTFPLSQVVAITTILGMFLSAERKRFPVERETILLISLWLVFGLTTLFALYPVEAFEKFEKISKIMLMIVVATVLINSEYRLHWLIRVIGFSIGFYGLKGGIWAVLTGGGQLVYGPEHSFLNSNNAIGLALDMNIPILLYLLKREERLSVRWIVRAMLVFSYPAVLCTFSRGAWLGLVLVTALSLLKSRRKFVLVPIAGILLVLLLSVAPQIVSNRLVQRYDTLVNYHEDHSAQSRLWSWEFCKRVGLARPLTGAGFEFYRREAVEQFYPGYLEFSSDMVWSCHSSWLTVFGEHGMPGMILWLSLFACCFMSLRQIRAVSRANPDRSYFVELADMVQSSLIAYFIVGTFVDAAYFDMVYYLLTIPVIVKTLIQTAPVTAMSSAESRVPTGAFLRRPLLR